MTRYAASALAAVTAFGASIGCGSSQQAKSPQAPTPTPSLAMQWEEPSASAVAPEPDCPLHPRAYVKMVETPTGVALLFQGMSSDAPELREAVHAFYQQDTLPDRQHAYGQGTDPGEGSVLVQSYLLDAADGARLFLTPVDASQKEQLLSRVRAHLEDGPIAGCARPLPEEVLAIGTPTAHELLAKR